MKKLLPIAAFLFITAFSGVALAGPDMQSSYMEKAISKLPKQKAQEFRDTMQQAHEENESLYKQARGLHQDMHNIMNASGTFDEDAFVAKSSELRELHEKIGENLDKAFASAVKALSEKERKMLSHNMEQAHEMHKKAEKSQSQ